MVIKVKKSGWRNSQTQYVIQSGTAKIRLQGSASGSIQEPSMPSPVHGSFSGLAIVTAIAAAAVCLSIIL